MHIDVIEVNDCWFKYEGSETWVLKGVSLRIKESSFNLVVGPTGSGKSTLLRLFNGLVPHFYKGEFKGVVRVKGYDTRKYSVAELSKHVGMVFQDPESQVVTLTVENEIAFGLENLGYPPSVIKERVNNVLRALGIEDLRHCTVFELSSGQLQRVVIASVLAMDPDIIVLDEPTSSLDPKSAYNSIRLLAKIRDEYGKTIIVADHRLDYIIPFADQVIVINRGEIIRQDEPHIILEQGVLEAIGVDEPKIPLLFKMLKKEGLYHDIIPLTVDEAVNKVRSILSGGLSNDR